MNTISSYCSISSVSVTTNGAGDFYFRGEESSVADFLKSVFKKLDNGYSKFYKMDALSKLAFLGVEILRNENASLKNCADDEVALLFSNHSSSAETDNKFRHSYEVEKTPGPALFVYTLPSILLGEIAIRNKWYGENLFTIHKEFDAAFFSDYSNVMLNGGAKAVLCGWVEVNEEEIEGLFFVAEKNGKIPLAKESINELYKTTLTQSRHRLLKNKN